MELALLVLLVVLACSILLVTSALTGKEHLQAQEQKMRQQLVLDEMAQQILSGITPTDAKFSDFQYSNTATTLVITDKDGNPLLSVTTDGSKITGWKYS